MGAEIFGKEKSEKIKMALFTDQASRWRTQGRRGLRGSTRLGARCVVVLNSTRENPRASHCGATLDRGRDKGAECMKPYYTKCLFLSWRAKRTARRRRFGQGAMAKPPPRKARQDKKTLFCSLAAVAGPPEPSFSRDACARAAPLSLTSCALE